MSKPRLIKDYQKLSEELKEQLKLVYPKGFSQHLISFQNKEGEKYLGLLLETDEAVIIVKMSKAQAVSIIEEDEDFDEMGNLKPRKKALYEDKYDDLDYLEDFNDNEDNDLGEEDVDQLSEDSYYD